jgi:hypothetical protein
MKKSLEKLEGIIIDGMKNHPTSSKIITKKVA